MNAPANPNKALWEKAISRIADTMRESGRRSCRLGITKDLKCWISVAAMARRLCRGKLGARRVGIDIARNLVEAGNRRAQEQGLTNLKFQEGDASNLEQVPDKFDLVVSIFGAMFAPPLDVPKRWCVMTRPGGRIVMGNWIPTIRHSWLRF
jgi:SAM-dependent methyltransferase